MVAIFWGPAHPRVCGENALDQEPALITLGSSPRVRGKLSGRLGGAGFRRLIPACAGKTTIVQPRLGSIRAHPRVCGENLIGVERELTESGSSPRVRGKPLHMDNGDKELRLIPACAGKTLVAIGISYLTGAHPRVCGENVLSFRFGNHLRGSSPRVRGKRN